MISKSVLNYSLDALPLGSLVTKGSGIPVPMGLCAASPEEGFGCLGWFGVLLDTEDEECEDFCLLWEVREMGLRQHLSS